MKIREKIEAIVFFSGEPITVDILAETLEVDKKEIIENIEELISADDVDALLDAVDDAVVDNIVAHNNEPDKEGKRIQGIYDDIAAQNHVYWD